MLLSESFRIREPANKVTEGTDWVADQDRFILEIEDMFEAGFNLALFQDPEAEPDEIFLRTGNPSALTIAGENDVAGFIVEDLSMPVPMRKQESCAIVEIVTDAERTFLGWNVWRWN